MIFLQTEKAVHNIKPLWNENSKILILGSFPSVKSREVQFFYAYKYNRFWKVISSLLDCPEPDSIEEKRSLILNNNIALWDVIKSCDISGSSDSSISNVVVNDISKITNSADIKAVFTNGSKSNNLYKKYLRDKTGIDAIMLPSTSPANASYSLEKLIGKWQVILKYLK